MLKMAADFLIAEAEELDRIAERALKGVDPLLLGGGVVEDCRKMANRMREMAAVLYREARR